MSESHREESLMERETPDYRGVLERARSGETFEISGNDIMNLAIQNCENMGKIEFANSNEEDIDLIVLKDKNTGDLKYQEINRSKNYDSSILKNVVGYGYAVGKRGELMRKFPKV